MKTEVKDSWYYNPVIETYSNKQINTGYGLCTFKQNGQSTNAPQLSAMINFCKRNKRCLIVIDNWGNSVEHDYRFDIQFHQPIHEEIQIPRRPWECVINSDKPCNSGQ